jgi:hypothetical protein
VVAAATGILLVAAATMLLLLTRQHPGLMPVHQLVPLLYDVPLALAFTVISVAILGRIPGHPVGWLFGLLGIIVSFGLFTNGYAAWDLPGATWVLWIWIVLSGSAFFCLALALLLFPTGRPATRRWGWLPRLLWLYLAVAVPVRAAAPWPDSADLIDAPVRTELGGLKHNPVGVEGQDWLVLADSLVTTLGVLLLLAAMSSLLPRWRRSAGDERQQLKWLGLAGLVFAVELTLGLIQVLTIGFPEGDVVGDLVGNAIFTLTLAAIPVALGLGIVRYRLYHIDVLISRTIVYGSLAVFIFLAYVVGVVLIGELVGRWAGSSTVLALAATAVVAVAFHPLRTRLQAGADRWVYGHRAAPYELMARFGHDLGQAVAPGDVLARIAETAGQAVRAGAVQVTSTLPGGGTLAASWPEGAVAARFDTVVPVHHDGAVIAEISVAGTGTRTGDAELLRHTAAVSAGALRNLRLLAELESLHATVQRQNREIAASRRRLVAAARVERRRLEREVSERLGPDLDALRDGLPALRQEAGARPEVMVAGCRRLAGHASHLVAGMRALSRGVLPPLLVDHGLAAALRAMLRRLDTPATLDLAPSVDGRRFAAPVETTVYLCCRAAVRAVTAPATVAGGRAPSTAVRLWRDHGNLAFSVTHGTHRRWDDGLVALHDRVATLGGALAAGSGHPDGAWSTLTGTVPVEPGAGQAWPTGSGC